MLQERIYLSHNPHTYCEQHPENDVIKIHTSDNTNVIIKFATQLIVA